MTHKEILEEMFLIMKMNELYSAGNNIHNEVLWDEIGEGANSEDSMTPFGNELCDRFRYLAQQYWVIKRSEEAIREEYVNKFKESNEQRTDTR